MLTRLTIAASWIARVSAWVTGAILGLSALVIGYDVAIRYLLNRTVGGGTEIAGYALALASAWGLTVALLRRSHVRVDSVYTHLPQRPRALLDMVGLLAFILFMALVTRYAYGVVQQSIISGTRSVSSLEIPLVIPQAIWFTGLVFFLVVAGLLLVRSVIAFLQGDLGTVHALIGARSTAEEIESEQKGFATRRLPGRDGKGGTI